MPLGNMTEMLFWELFTSTSVGMTHEIIRAISQLDSFVQQMKIQISPEAVDMLLSTTESTVSNTTIRNLKKNLTNGIKGSANTAYQTGMNYQIVQSNKRDQLFRWVNTGDRTCADCSDRDERIETLDTWINIGLPKSGFSVCGNRCNCRLVKA